MKIAITSQNRKTITEHAGMCRKFWVYEIQDQQVVGKNLLELEKEQSFHEMAHAPARGPHPLDDAQVLIAGSAGRGLQVRLGQRGMQVLVTTETDPDQAVQAWLAGSLPLATTPPHECEDHHGHGQGHGHAH